MADQPTASNEAPAAEPEQEVQAAPEVEREPMTTAVTRRPSVQIEERETMATIFEWGRLMADSGFFADARGAAQAAVKILAGRELGFGVVESMIGVYVIDNRLTMSANLMAVAVKRSGRYDYRVLEHTEEHCLIEFRQRDPGGGWERIGASEFSIEDAQRAGIVRPGSNWQKYPRNMVFARALSNGVRFHCPDAFGSLVYTPEEVRDDLELSPEGEIRDISAIAIAPPARPQNQQGGGARQQAPRGGQAAQTAPAGSRPATERKPPKTRMGPDDWTLVASVQTLMTWAHEAYGKVQADVCGPLGVDALPGITAKYKTPEDYREAVLELLHEWDVERYTRWTDEQINGPIPPSTEASDEASEDEDAAAEAAAAEYDAETAGPDSTVEVAEDGSILVGGEPAEPLP